MRARPTRVVSIGATPVNIRKSPINAKTFTVVAATDLFTAAAHGYLNGDPVYVSSTGTLPAPLAAGILYYVIWVSTSTFKLAASASDATAATPVPIDITTAGTGTHTINVDPNDPGCLPVTFANLYYTGATTIQLVPYADSIYGDGQNVAAAADFTDVGQGIARYAVASGAGPVLLQVTDFES